MLRGTFATMSPWDVFDWLARKKLSGQLVVERGDVSRRFQLAAGVVTRVSSTHPAEQLGRLLVGAGYISEEQLAAAMRGSDPLGLALVSAGLVAEDDLRAMLEVKMKESVFETLTWSEGTFAFEPAAAGARRGVQVAVPLRGCLEEGESRTALWRAVRERVPDDNARFRVVQSGGTADELVQDVARGLTVREIMLERRSLPFSVYRALAELADRGTIVPVTGEALRAIKLQDAVRSLLARWSVPRLARAREELAGEDLSPPERALLARVDGRWDLMALVRTSALGDAEALLAMERLVARGLVVL
jgi:uncharacterized protein DUF4388